MFTKKTASVPAIAPRIPTAVWSDAFGRLAQRCGQALLVLTIAVVVVIAAGAGHRYGKAGVSLGVSAGAAAARAG